MQLPKAVSPFSGSQIARQLSILISIAMTLGVIALLSRLGPHVGNHWLRETGTQFRHLLQPWPDLVEHGLGFMAFSLFTAALMWAFLHCLLPTLRPVRKSESLSYIRLQNWLLKPTQWRDLFIMVMAMGLAATTASFQWELEQAAGSASYAFDRGHLQVGQILADHLGCTGAAILVWWLVSGWYRPQEGRKGH